jgi:membrane associated rhomboid family serine protease
MSLDRGLVGASGAIAGVMGAYFVLVPGASIRTLVVLFIFITILEIPSGFFIFLWFVLQLFAGLGSILGPGAAVAYWAHIGGFVTGYILARGMNRPRRRPLPRVIEMDVRDL